MRFPLTWRWLALCLTLAALSCDAPSATELVPEPTAAQPTTTPPSFTPITERLPRTLPDMDAMAVIGPSGGTLQVFGHVLKVPPNAVSQQTVFVMTAVPSGLIEVELTAVTVAGGIPVTTFNKPLRLWLTYKRSRDTINTGLLTIVHVDGLDVEAVPVMVDSGRKKVRATLTHFSRYMLASN